MKTSKIILAALLGLTLSLNASAQNSIWEFGVKGGVALNLMPQTTVTAFDKVLPNFGFQAGGYVNLSATEMLAIQAEVLYSRKGVTTVNHEMGASDLKYSRYIHYIQIPLLIGFQGVGNGQLRVLLGPEFGACVGSRIKANYYDPAFESDGYKVNPFNLALALQGTYFITDSLGIDLKLEMGLTRTFVKSTEDKGRNASVQLGVSYRFGN